MGHLHGMNGNLPSHQSSSNDHQQSITERVINKSNRHEPPHRFDRQLDFPELISIAAGNILWFDIMPGTIPNITWFVMGKVSESGKSRDFWKASISGSGKTESF
jgi:hypothetical protein